MIDFEQLKITNVDLNEKIEERNEDIMKLKKKVTATVQVLTHVKEKLQFLQVRALLPYDITLQSSPYRIHGKMVLHNLIQSCTTTLPPHIFDPVLIDCTTVNKLSSSSRLRTVAREQSCKELRQ